jgi:hypothetical protein
MEAIIKATQELENIDEIGEYMELLISDKYNLERGEKENNLKRR